MTFYFSPEDDTDDNVEAVALEFEAVIFSEAWSQSTQ